MFGHHWRNRVDEALKTSPRSVDDNSTFVTKFRIDIEPHSECHVGDLVFNKWMRLCQKVRPAVKALHLTYKSLLVYEMFHL